PSAPSASSASTGHSDQLARSTSGMPSGAVSTSATACARQITGSAPCFSCSGRATLIAMPYDVTAATIISTPVVLLDPALAAGSAISTDPSSPIDSPVTI